LLDLRERHALRCLAAGSVTVDGVTQNDTFDTTGKSATNMGWTRMSLTFVATSTTSTLKFVSNVGSTTNAGAALDNVTADPISNSRPCRT